MSSTKRVRSDALADDFDANPRPLKQTATLPLRESQLYDQSSASDVSSWEQVWDTPEGLASPLIAGDGKAAEGEQSWGAARNMTSPDSSSRWYGMGSLNAFQTSLCQENCAAADSVDCQLWDQEGPERTYEASQWAILPSGSNSTHSISTLEATSSLGPSNVAPPSPAGCVREETTPTELCFGVVRVIFIHKSMRRS